MTINYGEGDNTYQALGGFDGISQLVNCFYDMMGTDKAYHNIHTMHTEKEQLKREKLIHFLCGWTGGKESYHQHYGKTISMPGAHAHLNIGKAERDMWLSCMQQALAQQNYPQTLQDYLLKALAQPAEIIRRISEKRQTVS